MSKIKCNFRSCLDQRQGVCHAGEIDMVDGKCQSIAWSRETMKANAPPIERRHGVLQRPGRSPVK